MNAEFIARSQEAWDAIEKDRWIYNLENDDGIAPNFNKKRKCRKRTNLDDPTNDHLLVNQIDIPSSTDHQVSNVPDDGFGPNPSTTTTPEDDIPDLLDIPESELEQ